MARELDPGTVIPLGRGLTSAESTQTCQMWDGSKNLYTDDEGYLTNYPGKSDVFRRPDGDPPATLGTPPPTNVKITRVFSFRDKSGSKRTVFVQGADLKEKLGNGFRVLHTFTGESQGSLYFPVIFQHDSFLVIVNPGDPPLIWDGVNGVTNLGVRERLMPPASWSHKPLGVHTGCWTGTSPVLWYPLEKPNNQLANNIKTNPDGSTTGVDGIYTTVVQGVDAYGNKGPCSGASSFAYITNNTTDFAQFMVTEWMPPLRDAGIHGYILGRTSNLHLEDDEGEVVTGVYAKHYQEAIFTGTTLCRFTHQISDANIIDNGEIDKTIVSAPFARVGASWSNRVFLSGYEQTNEVWWSDQGLFGQFRSLQMHKCLGQVEAIVPMGDRIAFITKSSVEVMYDNNGTLVLLEQHVLNSTSNGRSFVPYGNSIFGLWDRGFGFYDGVDFKFIESPFYIRGDYVDTSRGVGSAVRLNNWYLLSIRSKALSGGPNRVLMLNLESGEWYILHEQAYDFTLEDDVILMCFDSIYEMFSGDYSGESKIVIRGLVPPKVPFGTSTVLSGISILMQPGSNASGDLKIKSRRGSKIAEERDFPLVPSNSRIKSNKNLDVCWNDSGRTYSESHPWSGPDDVWITPVVSRPTEGTSHDIEITFPGSTIVKLRAISLSFSVPSKSE